MLIFRAYRSRKYRLHLLLSVSVFAVILLIISSISIYQAMESNVLKLQREHTQNVLAQINFNIENMDEIVKNLTMSLFADNELITLLYQHDIGAVELARKMSRLRIVVASSSYLDSIVFYNAVSDTYYSMGNSKFGLYSPYFDAFQDWLAGMHSIPRMRMIPLSLNGKSVEAFSYIMYDNTRMQGRSLLIVNVKPEWLYDNIRKINDLAVTDDSDIFLIDDSGMELYLEDRRFHGRDEIKSEVLSHLRKGASTGYFVHATDGDKYVVSFTDTAVEGFRMVSIRPYSVLSEQIQRIRSVVVAFTGVFLLLAIVASLGIVRRLYRPVDRLLKQIKLDMGSWDRTPASDELSLVSMEYRSMEHKLEQEREEGRSKRKVLRSYYLRRLLSEGETSRNAFATMIVDNAWSFDADHAFLVAGMRLNAPALLRPSESELVYFAIQNIAGEIVGAQLPCETVNMHGDHLVLLVGLRPNAREEDACEALRLLRNVQDIVGKYYKVTFSIAVDKPLMGFWDITNGYDTVLQLLQYQLIFGRGAVITPDRIQRNIDTLEYHIPPVLERKLGEEVKGLELDAIDVALGKALDAISTFHAEYIPYAIMHMLVVIKHAVREMNLNRIQPIAVDLDTIGQSLSAYHSLDELRETVIARFRDALAPTGVEKEERSRILVEAIKDIVKGNYKDDNLSLQSIADMLNISTDYVGRQFKKVENMSVSDYMNELRLQDARMLLENTDDSVLDIMMKVGYFNQSYFFKLFKKKFGTTPRQYRMMKKMN